MSGEEWRPVPGYQGFYEVSSLGRVRRLTVKIRCGYGKVRTFPGRVMRHGKTHGGYHQFSLCKHGTVTRVYVHRTVIEAFIGPIPDGMQINHLSGDKNDNSLKNLAICTPSENMRHSTDVLGNHRGALARAAKLSERQVLGVISDYALGMGITALARALKVDPETVRDIISGRTWRHITGLSRPCASRQVSSEQRSVPKAVPVTQDHQS